MWALALCIPTILALSACATPSSGIAGQTPAQVDINKVHATHPANAQALLHAYWTPGLDEGDVPQGLTTMEDSVLLATYRSSDPKIGHGPCRVYRLRRSDGAVTGTFELPESCGHAGGLAYLGHGMLAVADGRHLYRIDLARAFFDGNSKAALRGEVTLQRPLNASSVAFSGNALFIASFSKDTNASHGWFLAADLFDRFDGKSIDEAQISRRIPVTAATQGCTFDKDGTLWLSQSTSQFGRLQKINPNDGSVLASYPMVSGTEDLEFDDNGVLWSVSEAGTRRWSHWKESFPAVFAISIDKLAP